MARSRVNHGHKAHRRLVHKREQIRQGRRLNIMQRQYLDEVMAAGNELSEHHATVHADCKWPADEIAEPPAAEPVKEIA